MEIERKWMVEGWPQADLDLPLVKEQKMRQGYLHALSPIVRIREEAAAGGDTAYILCIKSAGLLVREEVEVKIPPEKFKRLEKVIGLPLIEKEQRVYKLPDGLHLEVNHVDEGLPTEFWYAEIEYNSEEQARGWTPQDAQLAAYLGEDVTEQPGQSMAAYWLQTRQQS